MLKRMSYTHKKYLCQKNKPNKNKKQKINEKKKEKQIALANKKRKRSGRLNVYRGQI